MLCGGPAPRTRAVAWSGTAAAPLHLAGKQRAATPSPKHISPPGVLRDSEHLSSPARFRRSYFAMKNLHLAFQALQARKLQKTATRPAAEPLQAGRRLWQLPTPPADEADLDAGPTTPNWRMRTKVLIRTCRTVRRQIALTAFFRRVRNGSTMVSKSLPPFAVPCLRDLYSKPARARGEADQGKVGSSSSADQPCA